MFVGSDWPASKGDLLITSAEGVPKPYSFARADRALALRPIDGVVADAWYLDEALLCPGCVWPVPVSYNVDIKIVHRDKEQVAYDYGSALRLVRTLCIETSFCPWL